jgi:hypothetical protein
MAEVVLVTMEQLQRLAETLARMRDDHLRLYAAYADRADLGRASAYRLALALLHTSSDGRLGAHLDDQPSPYPAVAV